MLPNTKKREFKVYDGRMPKDNLLENFCREEPKVSPVRSGDKFSVKHPKELVIGELYQSFNRNHKKSFVFKILSAPYEKDHGVVVDVLRDGTVKDYIYLTDYSILPYGAKRWSFNYLKRIYLTKQ